MERGQVEEVRRGQVRRLRRGMTEKVEREGRTKDGGRESVDLRHRTAIKVQPL